MQQAKRFLKGAGLLLAGSFLALSCRKNVDKTGDEDTGYATEHAMLEKTFSDAQSIADEGAANGSLSNFRISATILSSCATVTNDTVASPHLLTIDFGSANCLCQDGVYRRGKILVSYTGRYKDPAHVHSISFDQYFANDNGVSGTKTVTAMGNNSAGQPYYQVLVNGSIALANNGGTISWTSSRTRTWVAGYSTSGWQDDEYQISGSGSITRANGKTFDINITSPLDVALNCRWIRSGVLTIMPSGGGATRTLDYGSGSCDAQANYTVNGTTYSITLR